MNPIILPAILQSHKERVREMLTSEFEGPQEHAATFDKYSVLITKQVRNKTKSKGTFFLSFSFVKADADVEQFLSGEHTFNEYVQEVRKYKSTIEDITYNLEKEVRRGMFEIHCNELIRSLAKRAEVCMNRLLERMVKDHREHGEE